MNKLDKIKNKTNRFCSISVGESEWLIARIEQLRKALEYVEHTDSLCPWCWQPEWESHKPDCPRQLALIALEEE